MLRVRKARFLTRSQSKTASRVSNRRFLTRKEVSSDLCEVAVPLNILEYVAADWGRLGIAVIVENLRNAFSLKPVRSLRKAHRRENLSPQATSFSARSGFRPHRLVKMLKAFCKMLTGCKKTL